MSGNVGSSLSVEVALIQHSTNFGILCANTLTCPIQYIVWIRSHQATNKGILSHQYIVMLLPLTSGLDGGCPSNGINTLSPYYMYHILLG